jgi:hypothetical protein
MPEFPSWKRPSVGLPEALEVGRSQLGRVVSDLRAAGLATRAVPTRAAEIAGQTRSRFEQLPGVVLGEVRRRVNVLDLATKQDVAAQSKLGRNRVSFVLREFLEAQQSHDEALAESIRLEVRDELRNLVAALDDDDLAESYAEEAPSDPPPRAPSFGLHDLFRVDDESDGVPADWIRSARHHVDDAKNDEETTPRAGADQYDE